MNEIDRLVGDRGDVYGHPNLNLGERTARLWTAYLKDLGIVRDVDGRDVANMMILVKMARLQHRANHQDSWRDMAGYAETGRIMNPEL